jgi:hypothetical protein
VSLLLNEDTGETFLLCPRCLHQVPYPRQPQEITQPAERLGTAVTSAPPRHVPTIESEVKRSTSEGYYICLAVLAVAVLGVALALKKSSSPDIGSGLMLLLALLILGLTVMIMYPHARSQFRAAALASRRLGETPGQTAARATGVLLLMLFLFPVAFFIVCFTVCTATLLVP